MPTDLNQRAKAIEFAFPEGPNDVSADRNTHAGQFWRAAQFHTSCTCWQVMEGDFHPSY